MFSRKNTIIIALIAIFVLGSVVLHAETIDVEIWNVYSRNWGHESVTFNAVGQGTGSTASRETGYLYNLTPPMVAFDGIGLVPDTYNYTAAQDTRSVTGEFHYQDGFLKCTLPGQWEPIPDNPPAGN